MKYFGSRISENMVKTPEGFLVCLGVPIARTGIYDYAESELDGTGVIGDSNGIVKVSRDEDEVFSPATLASFESKPFVVTHPPEGAVTPVTWNELAVGHLINIRRGKDDQKNDLLADVMITDADAIRIVESGEMREVSCGYNADYNSTGKGKAKQSNIVGNHLALVEQGRAGSGYAINDHKGDKKMNFKQLLSGFAKDPEAIKAMKQITADAKAADEDIPSKDEQYGAIMDKMDKMCDAVNALVSNQSTPTTAAKDKGAKDADKSDDKPKEKVEDEAEDMPGWAQKLCDRIDALEAKSSGDDDDEVQDEESEEDVTSGDDDEDDDSDNTADGDPAPQVISGDSASRVEILAPGLRVKKDEKGFKAKALKVFVETKDGKKIIDALNGGKKVVWNDSKMVDKLFMGASEVLKVQRKAKNAGTKTMDAELIDGTPADKIMTPEAINKKNEEVYAKRAN